MRLKNSRKRPDYVARIPITILSVLLLFVHCKEEPEQEFEADFSPNKLFREVRLFDSTSKIPGFKPDTGYFAFTDDIIRMYYHPVQLPVSPENISWFREAEYTQGAGEDLVINNGKEFWLKDGKVSTIIQTDSAKTDSISIKYDISGRLTQVVKVDPVTKEFATQVYDYNPKGKVATIRLFDQKYKLRQTRHFKFSANGNLASVFSDSKSSKDFAEYYYFNHIQNSSLLVQWNTKGKGTIEGAIYTVRDSLGHLAYEETYNNLQDQPLLTKKYFRYNPYNDIEFCAYFSPPGNKISTISLTFPQRDPSGIWTERHSFINEQLFAITKRQIKYLGQ